MRNIDTMIVVFSFCFGAVLLAVVLVTFGERIYNHIRKSASRVQSNGGKDIGRSSNTLIDYNKYHMTIKERTIYILSAGAIIFAVGYIFYRSIVLALFLVPLALLYPGWRKKEIIRKRKNELNLQFREALYSVASSLRAGKSIETAFKDAEKELTIQYPDTETNILVELEQINKRIEMNETIEEVLADFAARSHLEDILNFTEVFAICKRSGGNLVQVVKNTAEIISEKIDVKQEINVLLTEKRLEHKVLNLMPVLIVLLLSTSAEEFMAPVFSEPLGRAAMTFSLLLFTAAYFISKKIMDIEV
ncbi:MAG TPA: type II secretion system F family protein [Clostridia bacterium]|nr:type II secretion system F family protein [Clostridia bacterium]